MSLVQWFPGIPPWRLGNRYIRHELSSIGSFPHPLRGCEIYPQSETEETARNGLPERFERD